MLVLNSKERGKDSTKDRWEKPQGGRAHVNLFANIVDTVHSSPNQSKRIFLISIQVVRLLWVKWGSAERSQRQLLRLLHMVERTLHLLSILNCRAKKKERNSWWILAKEGESGDELLKFEFFAQTCLQEYTASQCTAPRTNHKETLPDFYLSKWRDSCELNEAPERGEAQNN